MRRDREPQAATVWPRRGDSVGAKEIVRSPATAAGMTYGPSAAIGPGTPAGSSGANAEADSSVRSPSASASGRSLGPRSGDALTTGWDPGARAGADHGASAAAGADPPTQMTIAITVVRSRRGMPPERAGAGEVTARRTRALAPSEPISAPERG